MPNSRRASPANGFLNGNPHPAGFQHPNTPQSKTQEDLCPIHAGLRPRTVS